MLSLANIAKSASYSSYYENEDYYSRDVKDEMSRGEWFGSGALDLGFVGRIERDHFRELLKGRLPNGCIIGSNRNGKFVHALGVDLTFSAPKSVSIAAQLLEDDRVYRAQDFSVKTVLGYIEANFMLAMVSNKGISSPEQIKNLVATLFTHYTSRNLDPQLHTHCLIHNVGKNNSGQWRAVNLEQLFENKMFLGNLYRKELAYNLAKIGYKIERKNEDGRFEIKGIPTKLLEIFSTRSQQIRKGLQEYNFQNAKVAEIVNLKTRAKKNYSGKHNLRQEWQNKALDNGFDLKSIASEVIKSRKDLQGEGNNFNSKKIIEKNLVEKFWHKVETVYNASHQLIKKGFFREDFSKEGRTLEAISYAIAHLSERESVFSLHRLIKEAMNYGFEKISIEDIKRGLDLLVNSGKCIVKDNLVTTQEILTKEKQVIAAVLKDKNKYFGVYSLKDCNDILSTSKLNYGQRAAVKLIISGKDRVAGIYGHAGVGKTFMLNEARILLNAKGYKLYGLAPSASATQTLKQEAKIEGETLQRFLTRFDKVGTNRINHVVLSKIRQDFKKNILVIDESSMISLKQMDNLLKITKKLQMRVILLGDYKQLSGVEAGRPFEQLIARGMNHVKIEEIVRQRNLELKKAVYSSLRSNINKAFTQLGDNIIEDKHNFIKQAAEKWLSLNDDDRQQTLLLAPSHKARQEINQIIRNELIKEKLIANNGINQVALYSCGFTLAQKHNPQSYQIGDVIIFNRANFFKKINKNDSFKIEKIEKNHLYLYNATGKVKWDLTSKISKKWQEKTVCFEVYREKNINIAEGDKIRFTKNDIEKGIINSHSANIIKIAENNVILKLENGSLLSLDKNQQILKHIDYAYSFTVHSAQGKTSNNVIAVMASYEKYLTNNKMLYVEISRAKDQAHIFMDNKDSVRMRLEKNIGQEYQSALSLIESSYEGKVNKENIPDMQIFQDVKDIANYASKRNLAIEL